MIKVLNITREPGDMAMIVAIADTKEEVGTSEFVGLPEELRPSMGSAIITVSGDIAFLSSENEWNWIGEEEDSRSVSAPVRSITPISENTKSAPVAEEPDETDTEDVGETR